MLLERISRRCLRKILNIHWSCHFTWLYNPSTSLFPNWWIWYRQISTKVIKEDGKYKGQLVVRGKHSIKKKTDCRTNLEKASIIIYTINFHCLFFFKWPWKVKGKITESRDWLSDLEKPFRLKMTLTVSKYNIQTGGEKKNIDLNVFVKNVTVS